jgi:hypothetical protein
MPQAASQPAWFARFKRSAAKRALVLTRMTAFTFIAAVLYVTPNQPIA